MTPAKGGHMTEEAWMTCLEHRMDLMLERMKQNDKQVTERLDAMHRRMDDMTGQMNTRLTAMDTCFGDLITSFRLESFRGV
jgi:hypothetical protein